MLSLLKMCRVFAKRLLSASRPRIGAEARYNRKTIVAQRFCRCKYFCEFGEMLSIIGMENHIKKRNSYQLLRASAFWGISGKKITQQVELYSYLLRRFRYAKMALIAASTKITRIFVINALQIATPISYRKFLIPVTPFALDFSNGISHYMLFLYQRERIAIS